MADFKVGQQVRWKDTHVKSARLEWLKPGAKGRILSIKTYDHPTHENWGLCLIASIAWQVDNRAHSRKNHFFGLDYKHWWYPIVALEIIE